MFKNGMLTDDEFLDTKSITLGLIKDLSHLKLKKWNEPKDNRIDHGFP
jgi:hypothetical protein